MAESGLTPRASPLARYLLAAYLLLIVYGTLHPLSGWSDDGVRPLAFLDSFWPQYYTRFDIAMNVLAYLPLGLLTVLALYPRVPRPLAWLIAILLGTSLSLGLETLQNYVPTRVPSALDFALNSAGAALGGLFGLYAAPRWIGRGALYHWRNTVFHNGHVTDLGLVLLGAWLLSQLRPESLLFGNGDLRFLFDTLPKVLHDPSLFVRVEALVTSANLIAVALLLSLLLTREAPRWRLFLLLLLAAGLVRMLAFMVLFDGRNALAWFTPGARVGLLIGTPVALAALSLPRRAAVGLCGLLLMAATALVNLAPGNPYLVMAHQAWYQGHFLNFNGLTRVVSTLWPFAALGYLLAFGVRGRAGA